LLFYRRFNRFFCEDPEILLRFPQSYGKIKARHTCGKLQLSVEIVTGSAISRWSRSAQADFQTAPLSRGEASMMHSVLFALIFVAAVMVPVFMMMRVRAAKD